MRAQLGSNGQGCPACGDSLVASSSGRTEEHELPRRYMCHFFHRFLGFRIQEAEALAHMPGSSTAPQSVPPDSSWQLPDGASRLSPLWYLTLPSDVAAEKLAGRSLLIKVGPDKLSIAYICHQWRLCQTYP